MSKKVKRLHFFLSPNVPLGPRISINVLDVIWSRLRKCPQMSTYDARCPQNPIVIKCQTWYCVTPFSILKIINDEKTSVNDPRYSADSNSFAWLIKTLLRSFQLVPHLSRRKTRAICKKRTDRKVEVAESEREESSLRPTNIIEKPTIMTTRSRREKIRQQYRNRPRVPLE